MMDRTVTDIRFPKMPLFGVAALVVITIALVAAQRLLSLPATSPAASLPVIETRLLTFEDSSDGSVIIRDANDHALIAIAEPGTNGFLRGTLRGLMRTRSRESINLLAPFRLSKLGNGALMLIDETNNVTLNLDAFGHTNADTFRAFLTKAKGGS